MASSLDKILASEQAIEIKVFLFLKLVLDFISFFFTH